MTRVPLPALVMTFAALAACGCSTFMSRPAAQYTTVAADPNRDEAKAVAKTGEACKFFQEGKWDRAEQSLQEALIADVMYGPAHNNLGRLYFEQEKYYLAAWEFEYAAKIMPDHPEPYNNLGMVFEAVDRLDPAIEQYTKAHRMAPQNPEFIGNLARAVLKKDERSPEARPLLSDLLLYDSRPDWVAWAREQLAVAKLPPGLARPEVVPTPMPLSTTQSLAPGETWATDPPVAQPTITPSGPNDVGPALQNMLK